MGTNVGHKISGGITAPVPETLAAALTGGGSDPLVFHALDDVAGTFSADVIIGTGNITEARTSTIYLPDDSSPVVWKSYGSTVPGEYYAGGKWWLYGALAATNQIIYSRDLTNAAWTSTNITKTYNQTGLTGAVNTASLLDDSDAGQIGSTEEVVTILDDSNIHTARLSFKKDTDETRFPGIFLQLAGGTAQNHLIHINTKTGALSIEQSTGTGTSEVNQVGDWWEVLLSLQNNSAGNTLLTMRIYPARGTVIGTVNVAATGSIIVGNAELYLNTTIAQVRGSSPIFAAGSTVSVVATDDSFDDADHPAQGGYFINWTPQYATSEVSGNIEIISLDNAAGLLYYDADNSLLKSTDGTNTASVALTVVAGTTYKCWVAYGGTSLQVGVNANTGTAGTFDGAFASGTKIEIVTPSGNVNLTRNLRAYNQSFASAVTTLQALAA